MEDSVPIIKVKNLNKSFGGKLVLKDINFEVYRGELFVIVGYSGSGKSTLLRVLAGLEDLDSGEILFNGSDVSRVPPQKRKIGMVFQDYAIWPHMSVRKNIEFVLNSDKSDAARKNDFIVNLLTKVGLSDKIDSTPSQLSGGQLQRVALARALAVEPDILLMDEPLSNLDRQVKKSLQLEILRITKEMGVTTLFVTHDQEEAQLLADRIAVMNSGVIEQVGDQRVFYENPVNVTVASFMDEVIQFSGRVEEFKSGICKVRVNEKLVEVVAENKVELAESDMCTICLRMSDLELNDSGWIDGLVISDKFFSGKNHIIVNITNDLTVNLEINEDLKMDFGKKVKLSTRGNVAMVFLQDAKVEAKTAAT
jgi:ABC-type Fe3+/spermidine/putrescine transport system ATPase subunit